MPPLPMPPLSLSPLQLPPAVHEAQALAGRAGAGGLLPPPPLLTLSARLPPWTLQRAGGACQAKKGLRSEMPPPAPREGALGGGKDWACRCCRPKWRCRPPQPEPPLSLPPLPMPPLPMPPLSLSPLQLPPAVHEAQAWAGRAGAGGLLPPPPLLTLSTRLPPFFFFFFFFPEGNLTGETPQRRRQRQRTRTGQDTR